MSSSPLRLPEDHRRRDARRGTDLPDAERTARPIDLFRLGLGGANTIATVVLGSFPSSSWLSLRDALLATPSDWWPARRSWRRWRCSAPRTAPTTRCRRRRISVYTAASSDRSYRCSTRRRVLLHLGVELRRRARQAARTAQSDCRTTTSPSPSPTASSRYWSWWSASTGSGSCCWSTRSPSSRRTVLFLLGIFAFAGTFDPGYAGIYGPGADAATNALFWPSFVGAALIVMSNLVSFGAFLGDWARYIPQRDAGVEVDVGVSFWLDSRPLVPFLFGLVTRDGRRHQRVVVHGRGRLRRRSAGRVARAGTSPQCALIALIGGMSTGTTVAAWHRLGLLQRVSRGSTACRRTVFIGVHRDWLHLRRQVCLQCGAEHFDVLAVLIAHPYGAVMVVMMIGWFVRRDWYDSMRCRCSTVANAVAATGSTTAGTGAWLGAFGWSRPCSASASSTFPASSSARSCNLATRHRPADPGRPRLAARAPRCSGWLLSRPMFVPLDGPRAVSCWTSGNTPIDSSTRCDRRNHHQHKEGGESQRMTSSVGPIDASKTRAPRTGIVRPAPSTRSGAAADIVVVRRSVRLQGVHRPRRPFGADVHAQESSRLLRPYNPAMDVSAVRDRPGRRRRATSP